MGNGPGGLDRYDDLFTQFPRLHGGFIWEWRDHGLRTRTPDGVEYFGYGGDFGEVVHDGNFVMDGMVLPDGTPTPGLAEFAAVNAPVTFVREGEAVVATNRQHTRSTAGLRFVGRLEVDGRPTVELPLVDPGIEPGDEATLAQPASLRHAAAEGETWLTVRAELASDEPGRLPGTSWPRRSSVSDRQRRPARPPGPVTRRGTERAHDHPRPGDLRHGHRSAALPARAGRRRAPARAVAGADGQRPQRYARVVRAGGAGGDRGRGGARAELGRALAGARAGPAGAPGARGGRAGGPGRGADAGVGGQQRTVRRRRLPLVAGRRPRVASRGHPVPGLGLHLAAGRHTPRPTGHLTEASWCGTGPDESYPDTRQAAQVGRFSAAIDDLAARYSRPQESGHRAELRELEIGSGDGVRLRVRTAANAAGHRPGFTLRRHTPQQVDRAAHPYELSASDQVYLFLDDAVHGIGSRSCGLDVLPEHALWPSARAFTVWFPMPAARGPSRRRSRPWPGTRSGLSRRPGSCGRTARPRAGPSG